MLARYFTSTLLLVLFFSSNIAFGQLPEANFGHNRLQYKIFEWSFYSSENFEIYFYGNGAKNAKLAAQYLEEEYISLTDILGYAPYSKTKIFLYNSPSDLKQSNVGINENNFTTGGQTNFVKSQIEVAFPGTHEQFKEDLRYKVSWMLINDMMYGGSLTDMFQNAYLLNLPDWFIEGAALYVSKGWSIEMDDYTRDLFTKDKVKKLTKYSGRDAGLVGQSIWNFIAIRYGRSNVSNILNLTRIIRNEENSIANTLGMPFKAFLLEWQNFYTEMAAKTADAYREADDSTKVDRKNKKNHLFNSIKLSPDGKLLAYSQNSNGKSDIFIKEISSGKEKKVFSLGQKLINQEINENIPLLAWKDNNTLGIIGSKRGKLYLWQYEVSSKSKLRSDLSRFGQVNSFSFNDGGTIAVLSADMAGQSDLFLISIRRNAIKRLTNDIFDENYPKFIPNTTAIIFSSNRLSDSLTVSDADLSDIGENHNLFAYDIDTTRTVLKRITNTISKDINPLPMDDNTIYYLSDQKGIYNIFKYTINDSIYTQVTNYNSSVDNYDYFGDANILSFVMMDNGRQYAHLDQTASLDQNIFTPATQRQEIEKAKYVSELLRKRRNKASANKQQADSARAEAEVEAGAPDLEISESDSASASSLIDASAVELSSEEEASDLIDTDNYVFDAEVEEESQEQTSFLARLRQSQSPSKILGPYPYFPRFSADRFFLSWIVDPLIGFGIHTEIGMNDMLENHIFRGGIVAATANLKSGRVYADYQFLKYLLDFSARFERNSLFLPAVSDTENEAQKYILNKFEIGASYPLNVSSRLSLKPFFAQTRYIDLHRKTAFRNGAEDTTNVTAKYGGARLEYIFDNTVVKGLNLYEGTRAILSVEHNQGFSDANQSFSNVQLDLRHYQKIHREITLATRIFAGHYFGNSPKKYLLGGMDNWLFNEIEGKEKKGDPLYLESYIDNSDILFHRFVTNLRGFNHNKFNGSTTFLFNAELRVPLIKYFHRGPIASNFFRNLQFIGFYDFGSAWSGNSPFEENNSINTELIGGDDSPFLAKIQNFKNPWLASYGVGARTVLLGYYLKFDVAWPIEDYIIGEPKYYLTLGYDF